MGGGGGVGYDEDELQTAATSTFSDRVLLRRSGLQQVPEDLSWTGVPSHRTPTRLISYGGESRRRRVPSSSSDVLHMTDDVIDGMVELKIDEEGQEYYEKTVIVREEIVVERIKRVDVNTVVEEVKMVPKIIEVEKIVEVPEIVCQEIPNYKEIEVPEIVEQVVYREIPIPQLVEVEVPEVVDKIIEVDI